MSRIGNRKLTIPAGCQVDIKNNHVTVIGPKGNLELDVNELIKIIIEDSVIKITRSNEEKHTKQLHGTYNSLIQGMIEGVSQGFKKELVLSGVGYKAQLKGTDLKLSLGFSHDISFAIPKGITITVPSVTEIIVAGINKQLVGEVAANIRAYKKPEPYKGKGIKYKGEQIIRKVGKTAGK